MNLTKSVRYSLYCLSLCIFFLVSTAAAQTAVLSEEFATRSNLYQKFVKDPDKRGKEFKGQDKLRTAWDISSTPLIQFRQSSFGDVLPPAGTFQKDGESNADYFLGHLLNQEGTLVFKVDIKDAVSPQLTLQLAAAHAPHGTAPRFHDKHDYLEIWVQDKKAKAGTLVDRFEGGQPTGTLTSPLNGSLSTNFQPFQYDLSQHLPDNATRFNILIISSTGYREYVGIDDVVVTASASGDQCPNDPNKTAPGACGCGVADTDSDGDGTPDCVDACPADPLKIEPGICGCGTADTDSNGDGIADCLDECPDDPNKTAPGTCGCGVADTDSDGDGVADCVDGCPSDPAKTEPGVCGCGIPDDTPNCLFNGDFQTGDLTNWTADTTNGGSVTVMEEGSAGNFAAQLIAGNPVTLSTQINTPAEAFYLLFDTKFIDAAGDLTVSINGVQVASFGAPDTPDTDFFTQLVLVGNEAFQNLSMATVTFSFNGPTGTTLFIDNVVVIPATAGELCVYGGDAIGPDNSLVNGRNASSCEAGFSDDGTFNGKWYDFNIGAPGIGYTSDGQALLSKIRAVTTVLQRQEGYLPDWSKINWAVHVWELQSYLDKGDPVISVGFGNTPENWDSFKVDDSGFTVPDTEPFAEPGNNKDQYAYDMIFDLSKKAEFATPLPAGEYVIVFNGDSATVTDGEPGILTNGQGIGPTPYYSATGRATPIEPGLVYPRLISNADFRWALTVTEERLSCE